MNRCVYDDWEFKEYAMTTECLAGYHCCKGERCSSYKCEEWLTEPSALVKQNHKVSVKRLLIHRKITNSTLKERNL